MLYTEYIVHTGMEEFKPDDTLDWFVVSVLSPFPVFTKKKFATEWIKCLKTYLKCIDSQIGMDFHYPQLNRHKR